MDLKNWAKKKMTGGDAGGGEVGISAAVAPLFNTEIGASSLSPELAAWVESGAGDEPPAPIPNADEEAYGFALDLVRRDWGAYAEPWATVAYVYSAMTENVAPESEEAPEAPAAPPGDAVTTDPGAA